MASILCSKSHPERLLPSSLVIKGWTCPLGPPGPFQVTECFSWRLEVNPLLPITSDPAMVSHSGGIFSLCKLATSALESAISLKLFSLMHICMQGLTSHPSRIAQYPPGVPTASWLGCTEAGWQSASPSGDRTRGCPFKSLPSLF